VNTAHCRFIPSAQKKTGASACLSVNTSWAWGLPRAAMAQKHTSVHEQQDEGATVLLVIDMMSTWRFPDADKLLPAALRIAPAIARLKARCRKQGLPVIYANDNQGRWRSDWRQLRDDALAAGGDGAAIARLLGPEAEDYFVLKPMHSAFFATPMQLLLQHLGSRHLVLAGVASDQCVLVTAEMARMHGYDVTVPRDVVASQTPERERAALAHFEGVMKLRTTPAGRLHLH
jgi:nicotinamidase-related amidase